MQVISRMDQEKLKSDMVFLNRHSDMVCLVFLVSSMPLTNQE